MAGAPDRTEEEIRCGWKHESISLEAALKQGLEHWLTVSLRKPAMRHYNATAVNTDKTYHANAYVGNTGQHGVTIMDGKGLRALLLLKKGKRGWRWDDSSVARHIWPLMQRTYGHAKPRDYGYCPTCGGHTPVPKLEPKSAQTGQE
ncbi:unnamed protein product [Vitrella brassicaformis CCMP3155]|uniref:Uncharacterized protein n=2 Tax=Vitrella brassicaformis TaxID=1169539 RepID=A0A0G4EF41_VITBC|nr:unnamed protein product [Vitrella brassicaformis CCMP3155]|mmetsp:Transcript_30548/g.75841  ORF Transcript_30548/g.75841 Transcript_30548/m.75841 type:complete len:146 (+) Transcript_30548:212-649(+)|eukprot:CEL94581.1 unnamed protein product [Vitrella brassicaformis CCMP3155]